MINNLSPKRDFNPSNPNLEQEIKLFLTSPIKFDKSSQISLNQNRFHHPRSNSVIRKSFPYSEKTTNRTEKSSVMWNPPEVEDIGYNSGVRRAFDVKHKKYSEIVKRQNEQTWEDEEKYRRWKIKKSRQAIEPRVRDRDNHVLENVINSRNDYYVSSISNFRPPLKTKKSLCRAAPVEIRSVGKNRTYVWS